MSILIEGLEMPTNCESCPCKTADAFGGLGCQATGYIPLRKANQDRPDWCPLVPVQPHGDLIDKKTVSENLASVLNKKNPPFSYPDWNDAIVAMLTAPTIIPAEGGE